MSSSFPPVLLKQSHTALLNFKAHVALVSMRVEAGGEADTDASELDAATKPLINTIIASQKSLRKKLTQVLKQPEFASLKEEFGAAVE